MKLHNVLQRHATQLAITETVRRVDLHAEMGRLQAYPLTEKTNQELEALQADADNCGQALRRLGTFRPDKDPTCPYCWIVKGERSPVTPAARPELFLCASCEREYILSPQP